MKNIQELLKQVMRNFPQGVTVVTARGYERPIGLTVSSFTSVSLVPPLILISISKASPSHGPLIEAEHFVVNILTSSQAYTSERFAGRVGGFKFSGISYRLSRTGCPVLLGVLAWLECRKWATYDGGDHTIIVGEVINGALEKDALPLIYWKRFYTTIAEPPPASMPYPYESIQLEW